MYSKSFNAFRESLVIAYYYIVIADGIIDPREIEFGETMIKKEGIDKGDFDKKIEILKNTSKDHIKEMLKDCMKKLTPIEQVRIIAYMSKVADSDGRRDPSEMSSIQEIYKELHLHLNDIIREKESIV